MRSLKENLKKEPLLVRGTTMRWVVAGRFMETAKRTRKLIKKWKNNNKKMRLVNNNNDLSQIFNFHLRELLPCWEV